MRRVFVSGGTGYIGRPLIGKLLARGHEVAALVRKESRRKLPPSVRAVEGDALDADTFDCSGSDTFVHLIGTPRPSPWKAAQFRAIDLPALKASVTAAQRARIGHFVFVSVAQPAPVMRAYIAVRAECERIIAEASLPATILRPWYVLGPGHWWPLAISPLYRIAEKVPTLREGSHRLGLVSLEEMLNALVWATENPSPGNRILTVPDIRSTSTLA